MTVDWSLIKYFGPHEFACRGKDCCGGLQKMDHDFVARLDGLRAAMGRPLTVTSGYRCPIHNQRVSATGANGPHTSGRAADIAIMGRDSYALIRFAVERGFSGIGVNQKGAHHTRFLHLDTLPDGPGCPRPWVWSYP